MVAFSVYSQTKGTLTNNQLHTGITIYLHMTLYSLTSDVSCSPVVLSTQGMGGAQKAVLWPALPVHLCAHGNGRRQQEEEKEPEDCA